MTKGCFSEVSGNHIYAGKSGQETSLLDIYLQATASSSSSLVTFFHTSLEKMNGPSPYLGGFYSNPLESQ